MAQRPAPYRTPSRLPATTRARTPADLTRPIATTGDGRDITRPYRLELEEARDPRLMESVDWGVYDRIAQDPEVRSTFQQRRRAVTSADWDVLPGDGEEPRSVEAAEKLKANLEEVGLDATTEKMLKSVMNGYSVAELMWGPWNGLIGFVPTDRCRPVHVRHARRFRKDRDGRIRLLTTASPRGEVMPERKFWWVTFGADDDDDFYGRGLAADLYWPVLMKRNGFGFWNIALDKFGSPTAMGTYARGSTQEDIDKLLQSLEAIANDSGFVIPDGMRVELLQAAMSGNAGHESLIRICDEYIDKVILSQTMTTADGSSNAQAQVHAGVKMEVVSGDADLICESFNEGPARWWTDLNYGVDVASPVLVRLVDEEEDLKARADTDAALDGIGWVRTDESFKDTYGDGYVRKPPSGDKTEEKPGTADEVGGLTPDPDNADQDDNVVPFRPAAAASFAEDVAAALADRRDAVDGVVDALIAGDGYSPLSPIMGPIAAAIATSDSADALDEALIATLAQSDVDRLTETLARAGFAIRVAAETGDDA